MTRKTRRLAMIGAALAVLAIAAGLILTALSSSIAFFASPTDIADKGVAPGQRIRLGGLVEKGSLSHEGPETIRFAVTDTNKAVPSPIRASFRTSSAKGRAWWSRVRSRAAGYSAPTRFSPSTMSGTCLRKSPMR